MRKVIILSIMLAILSACNPYNSQIPEKYIGNWINIENGFWEYGLYEEFAIYKKDFWKYESVEISDNELNITISKLGENQKLKLNFENDTLLVINNNNSTKKYSQSLVNEPIENEIDNCEKDTINYDNYQIDSAIVSIYFRNTAKGFVSLFSRYSNPNNMNFTSRSILDFTRYYCNVIDSTEHFGRRYTIKIPVVGISEISNIINNSYHKRGVAIIQPNDTLMMYLDIDNTSEIKSLIMSSSQNFNRDLENYSASNNVFSSNIFYTNCLYSDINNADSIKNCFQQDSLNLDSYVKNSKYKVSEKFKSYMFNYYKYSLKIRLPYLDSLNIIHCNKIIEQDIFNSFIAFEYYKNYITDCWSDLYDNDTIKYTPSTPENLQLHKDWIVISWGIERDNQIIDPQFIKELGFSDEFIEFYRLQNALKCFEHSKVDDLKYSSIKDFEVEYVLRNIKNPSYLKFIDYYRTHVRNYHVTKNDNVLFYTYY
ncbi:MAG: hypothetical protein MJ211_01480 [Bacteroidales bacterium]|nr:hypothetical protein [Bacteroidales bacterium]